MQVAAWDWWLASEGAVWGAEPLTMGSIPTLASECQNGMESLVPAAPADKWRIACVVWGKPHSCESAGREAQSLLMRGKARAMRGSWWPAFWFSTQGSGSSRAEGGTWPRGQAARL